MAEAKRKLAAILSADVVGYSRLMGDDERATIATLDEWRSVFKEHIEANQGRVVDMAGDSVLAVFESAIGAVEAAVEAQGELAERNEALSEDRRMRFRIGVNLGDIYEKEDGSVYGDGVNVAARLESLASAGGVTVSGSIHDSVRGKLDLGYDFMGEQEVKNIADPVRAFRVLEPGTVMASRTPTRRPVLMAGLASAFVIVIGLSVWWFAIRDGAPSMVTADGTPTNDPVLATPTGASIAVLPFNNLSEDAAQETFADGITEDIITGLSRFNDLRVIARNSTYQYKGRSVDVRDVGRELGVSYVLEGSVRRAGNSLKVTALLLETRDGSHIWADSYSRDLTTADIFAIQDSIMQQIVGIIGGEAGVVSRAGLEGTDARHTDNLAAYDCVLRAYNYYDLITPDEHLAVRSCLEDAVSADPSYAEAWGWLSNMYQDEFKFGFNTRPDAVAPLTRAVEAARNAIKADGGSQIGYDTLASAQYFRGDLDEFRTAAERAVALNPNNSRAIAWMGLLMAFSGDWERGLPLVDKAAFLNPDHPGWYHAAFFSKAYLEGDYEAALVSANRLNTPGFYWHHRQLAMAYAQLGRLENAEASVAELTRLYPNYAEVARDDLEKWYKDAALVSAMMEGLEKAGLFDEPEAPARPVIAVLPFTNMSGDPEQEYFSDGITEDIITELTRFPDLAVIARNSTFTYKGQAVDVRQVGADLGARYVLEGSVRRAADQIRVTAQLIDAEDGTHLWAETYDRDLTTASIFEIQDEIAGQVTGTLADMTGVIRRAGLVTSKRKPPESLTAYECVLTAYEFYRLMTPDLHSRSRDCLERVVEREPDYAEALAFAAFIEQEAYSIGYNPYPDSLDRAALYAERAVAADPKNQNAQLALARTYFFRHDTEAFAARAQNVLDLNPNNAQAVASVGMHLSYAGYWERGLPLLEKAMSLNPRYPFWYVSPFFHHHYLNRDFDKALEYARQVQALAPDYFESYVLLAAASARLGREEEAAKYIARILEMFPEYPSFARTYWLIWLQDPELRNLLAEGLRKAGLDIPDEPAAAD